MHTIARNLGIGFILFCVLALVLKAFVPLGGMIGYAPFSLPIGPAGQPIEVVMWYGTEKEAWLAEAARRFEATQPVLNNRPVRIALQGMGSREIADRVANRDWGDTPPVVVSPASSLWLEVLDSEWRARENSPIIAGDAAAPQALVLTPLVVVAWEERAAVLWPEGPANFWHNLHGALASQQGWIDVASNNGFDAASPQAQQAANWGLVKFGHTSPLTSNSGAQTLILLAYGYYDKASDLTAADVVAADFQEWLATTENAVLEFGDSTGTFMEQMVQFGPSKYDLVVVYENLALSNIEAAQGRWGQNLRIYYPPANSLSDHPYAILDDPLTSEEQQVAAQMFRDYLLSEPIQQLALSYGFRPADPSVAIVTGDANNPFNKYAAYGVQVEITQQVQTPSGDVITTLLDMWRRNIDR